MPQSKSFTLIELLVVIAVMGLIASIVLVSMTGVRERARITKTLEFSHSVRHILGAEAVGIWSFDEGSGTTALDGSGWGNNGTLYNFASPYGWTGETPYRIVGSGAGKYALSFDGSDDFVRIPDSSSLRVSTVVTVSAWIYPRSCTYPGTSWAGIVAKSNSPRSYSFYTTPSSVSGYCRLHFSTSNCISVSPFYGSVSLDAQRFPLNQWAYVVAVANTSPTEGCHTYYINAKFAGRACWPDLTCLPGNNDLEPIDIGRTKESARFFNGLIDEVGIYGQALTLGEIQRLYAEGLERHKDLVVK